MAERLPFQDTKVNAAQSVNSIKDLLYSVGFKSIAELSNADGTITIVAQISQDSCSADFHFTANCDEIEKKLPSKYRHEARDKKARAIAWRLIFHQVKALHDAIRLGVINISEAFAGNLLIRDERGKALKLSDIIARKIEAGTLTSACSLSGLMLEYKGDK